MPFPQNSWPSWSNRYHAVSVIDPEDNRENMDEKESIRPMSWGEIFFEVYMNFFSFLFTARSKFPVFGFVIGIALGYTISLGNPYDHRPSVYLHRPVASEHLNTWGEDFYFYPPLDEDRYPTVPSYNVLPEPSEAFESARNLTSQSPITPLFVPFTRNYIMLRQTILSYIAAGWPRSQIYIIDNSGTMDANYKDLLSIDNPFHLNYTTFRGRYGVNIVRTPALLNFAQLQNYMLATAMNRNWTHYYWTHQDIVVLSDELKTPYRSLYENVLLSLAEVYPTMSSMEEDSRWGIVWYDFDWLTLVNVAAAADTKHGVGSWDTFIPYYATDCDYYERLRLSKFPILEKKVGDIFDLSTAVPDPEHAFFVRGNQTAEGSPEEIEEEAPGSAQYKELKKELKVMMANKGKTGRNTWQDVQKGGKGEPWTYDPSGFQKAWWGMADAGRTVYGQKWGVNKFQCYPRSQGKTLESMWNPEEPKKDEKEAEKEEEKKEEKKEEKEDEQKND
ncbi:hypothetical protein TWF694_001378 [Orbilia ellipsospora]|uniref:Glycosyltransferase family 34 protein n=1 Tax=Orbilia ellipsospora TaxID=2528407 RepID=A0AAV9XT16_9PEZI